MTTTLLIIDPQVDFCEPQGALFVPGAPADTARTAALLSRSIDEVDAVHVTLDSHHPHDISHPAWWVNPSGAHPAPFTAISLADLLGGHWPPAAADDSGETRAYLTALDASGRYPHVIWPEHCIIGTPGHGVAAALRAPLRDWALRRQRTVGYWRKGENPLTEHFSAIRAEVPRADDPHTQQNLALVTALRRSDRLWVAGQALSHCVANTVRDLIFAAPELAPRIELLVDCASPVPGFEALAETFVEELRAQGAQVTTAG